MSTVILVSQATNPILSQVPSLFQDNFDYGDIRRDFVHGVLTSDLLMKNIYCHVAKEGYAARVQDTRSYDAIWFVIGSIVSIWVVNDTHVSARTSSPGGHSHWYLTTIIQVAMLTITYVVTNMFPKTIQLFSRGQCLNSS
jgi:translation initiation factor eIF-2B subunit epsilon